MVFSAPRSIHKRKHSKTMKNIFRRNQSKFQLRLYSLINRRLLLLNQFFGMERLIMESTIGSNFFRRSLLYNRRSIWILFGVIKWCGYGCIFGGIGWKVTYFSIIKCMLYVHVCLSETNAYTDWLTDQWCSVITYEDLSVNSWIKSYQHSQWQHNDMLLIHL